MLNASVVLITKKFHAKQLLLGKVLDGSLPGLRADLRSLRLKATHSRAPFFLNLLECRMG